MLKVLHRKGRFGWKSSLRWNSRLGLPPWLCASL